MLGRRLCQSVKLLSVISRSSLCLDTVPFLHIATHIAMPQYTAPGSVPVPSSRVVGAKSKITGVFPSSNKRMKVDMTVAHDLGDGSLIEEDILCQICLGRMFGCIVMCSEGHSFCEKCFELLVEPQQCPCCREQPVKFSRNRSLEGIIAKHRFLCEYHCGISAQPNQLIEHQQHCYLRTIGCPFFACGHTASANGLVGHIYRAHVNQISKLHKWWDRHHYRSYLDMSPFFGNMLAGSPRIVVFMIDQMMDWEDGDAVVLVGKFYGEDTCLVHLKFYHVLVSRMVSFTLGRDTNISFTQKTEALQSADMWNATNLNDHIRDCVESGCIIAWENIRHS